MRTPSLILLLLLASTADAAPITYTIVPVSDWTGTITTDGFVGDWYSFPSPGPIAGHILDYTLAFDGGMLTPTNGRVVYQQGVRSTEEALIFDPNTNYSFFAIQENVDHGRIYGYGQGSPWWELHPKITFAHAPEPGTALLLGLGLLLLASHRRRSA